MITVALDAMGGDFGCKPIMEGLILALQQNTNFKVIAVGDEEQLAPTIPQYLKSRVSILHTTNVVSMSSQATDALKQKDSTIFKAVDLVTKGEADCVVSAGHSGATMSLATLKIGRIKGVSRPAIASLFPRSDGGHTLVLDLGANTDCNAKNLFEFAVMGKVYSEDVMNIDRPLVGLLSNGEEDSKGNEVTKEAFKLCSNIPNFIGNVEGNDIFNGDCDVITCDGFIGNIVLKTAEGVADTIGSFIKQNLKKSLVSIAGAVLMRKVFKKLKLRVDYAEYGGAPLLGLKAPAIVSHGKSNAKAIKNAIFQAINAASSNLSSDIEHELQNIKDR